MKIDSKFHTVSPMASVTFETEDGRSLQTDMQATETLLDAARRMGLAIPTVCERGQCGTCECDSYSADDPEKVNIPVRVCNASPQCDVVIRIRSLMKDDDDE